MASAPTGQIILFSGGLGLVGRQFSVIHNHREATWVSEKGGAHFLRPGKGSNGGLGWEDQEDFPEEVTPERCLTSGKLVVGK